MSREVKRFFTRPAGRLAKKLLVWIGTLHILAALGHAEGQTIFVRFDLKIPMLKTHPTISQAEAEISQALARGMSAKIRYWSFQPGGTNEFPRLEVGLKKDSKWEIEMNLVITQGEPAQPKAGPWKCLLYETADVDRRGIPTRDVFRDEVVAAFQTRMLVERGEAILGVLKSFVPLGKEIVAVPSRGAPMAVLGLNRDVYKDLVFSEFKLHFFRGNDVIAIFSEGTGYREFPGSPPFEAIGVEHRKWQTEDIAPHVNELDGLRPFVFFLNKLVEVTFVDGQPLRANIP